DLRQWLLQWELVKVVKDTVQTLCWSDAADNASDPESSSCGAVVRESEELNPELMLGLLAYCYAIGIYSTEEIARRTEKDAELRSVTRNRLFPLGQILLFRSHNRELLRHCLSGVFQSAWRMRLQKGLQSNGDTGFDLVLRKYFYAAAGH